MVSSMLADNHQPERRSGARDREGGCTAIEEIDNRRILVRIDAGRWIANGAVRSSP